MIPLAIPALLFAALLHPLSGPPSQAQAARPAGSRAAAGLSLLWTVDTRTLLESAPTIADLHGDGRLQILAAGREEMIALDGAGKELWRRRMPGRLMTYPAVLERKGRQALIYAADNGGQLTCLSGDGKVVWKAPLAKGSSWSSAVVCDLKRDGRFQVIQTDESGAVWAFDALTGGVEWRSDVKGAPASPAVGTVDGRVEIAVQTTAGELTLLDAAGKPLWTRAVSGATDTWATSAPILFAASDGHTRIAAGSSDGRVSCFNSAGKMLWSRKTRGSIAASLSAGDMDRSGRANVFAVTQTGVIYRFDEDGREIWSIDVQGRTIAAGALIDLTNSGRLDYVVSTQSGHLMVFDPGGAMIYEYLFPNRTINMTPAFGRVTEASPGLQMVITGGESGKVFCFSTPARADAPAAAHPWISYRGGNRKSGSWSGLAASDSDSMAPAGDPWDSLATGDPVRFRVHANATAKLPLHATASCVRPDGSLQSASTPVYGVTGEIELPVDVVRPGSYRFRWSVADGGGKRLAGGEHAQFVEPFAVDRALVERALAALSGAADRAAERMPLSARGLKRKAEELGRAADAVATGQRALPGSSGSEESVLADSAALVRTARRDLQIAAAVDSAREAGRSTSLIAFQSETWKSGGIDALVPEGAANPLRIRRRVVPGQHDGVSIKLFNVTDRELPVRVTIDRKEGDPEIKVMRSVAVPTAQGPLAWDALVDLDATSTITVPALETREVWLDAKMPQENQIGRKKAQKAQKGQNKGDTAGGEGVVLRVGFEALNGAGSEEMGVEVAYDLLPLPMAPERSFRLCCWANYVPGAVEDLLEHGNTVFIRPMPEPVYGAGGLTGLDTKMLDPFLAELRGHDVVVLLQGIPALKGEEGSAAYMAELTRFLALVVDHMAAAGFDYEHWALYPFDEPGGNGQKYIDALAVFGKRVKEIDSRVRIYVDGGAEMPMIRKIAPYIDIWTPPLGMLASDLPEMEAIRQTKKEIWSYDCGFGFATSTQVSIKDTNIVGDYRTAALTALRWRGAGFGFWCYNIGPDPWQPQQLDYPIVYPGTSKPVGSRRWEAVRESLQDARILIALRERAASSGDAALKGRVGELFTVRLPQLLDRSHQELMVGLGRATLEQSMNEQLLNAFRNEMLDCVEAATR
jgi:outer membrane protein assembly factor BamB